MVDKRGNAPQRIEAARALIAIANLVQVDRHFRHLLQYDEGKADRAGVHVTKSLKPFPARRLRTSPAQRHLEPVRVATGGARKAV